MQATEEATERADEDEFDVTEPPRANKLGELIERPRVRQVIWSIAGILAFWFVIQFFWPVSLGSFGTGAVLGGLTALIALSIALTYRSNRIINFAAADLGAPGAVFGVMLITAVEIPFLIALPVALVSAALLGLIVEFLVIRPFFKAPRLILTVVTIGLAQILGGVSVLIPHAFDQTVPAQDFPSPFDFSFFYKGSVFTGNHIIAMVAVPVILVGLGWFFRFTDAGIAVRASASSAERASLLGVPVKRMQTLVWVLVAVFATLAMILRAGVIGLPIGRLLGPSILLPALAAAVIGRMERFGVIVVASVAIGIVEVAIFESTGEAQFVAPILFAIILGALLLQRRSGSRLESAQTSTWRAVQEHRPIPEELRRLPEVVTTKLVLGGGLLAFLLAAPWFLSVGDTARLSAILIFAMLALSLVVLTGWAGEVSLGHVAFLGIGAAVAGALTQHQGLDLSLALLAAGVAGAVAAALIGIPALRVRGMFLAVATLGFALAVSDWVLNQRFFGDYLPGGFVERPLLFDRIATDTDARMYYVILVALVLMVFAVRGIRRSRTGRALISLRENERGAEAFGINATRVKLAAFAISGFIAAFAGGLFVHLQTGLGVNSYLPAESLKAFTMVVIGGLGSIPGAIMGAVYIQGLDWFLPRWLPQELEGVAPLLGSGLGLILVLLLVKGGLSQAVFQLRDNLLRSVAQRRDIVVPSLVADVRQERDPSDDALSGAVEASDREGEPAPTPGGNGGRRGRSKRARAKTGAGR